MSFDEKYETGVNKKYDCWVDKLDGHAPNSRKAAANYFMYMRVLAPNSADVEARLETLAPKACRLDSLQSSKAKVEALLGYCQENQMPCSNAKIQAYLDNNNSSRGSSFGSRGSFDDEQNNFLASSDNNN